MITKEQIDEIKLKIVKDAMNQLDYIGVERQRMEDLLFNVLNKGWRKAQDEIYTNVFNILDEFASYKDICPHCSATLKQTHYCDNCQERVSVSCECLNLMEEIKEELRNRKEKA